MRSGRRTNGPTGRSTVVESSASRPAMTPSMSARSAADRAIGPGTSSDHDSGSTPWRLSRPKVGLRPLTPHAEAGIRTEPPVSLPSAAGTSRAASAAPEPPLEPPGMWAVFQGLHTGPKCETSFVAP